MQIQGLPVTSYAPEHLKEGAYITAGSGGVALINKAPHPGGGARSGSTGYSRARDRSRIRRIFTEGNDGPDSLRIDIPKDKVPRGNRRPEADPNRYPFVDRAEWMDMDSISELFKDVMEQRKK